MSHLKSLVLGALALLASFVVYGWYHGLIILNISSPAPLGEKTIMTEVRCVPITSWSQNKLTTEKRKILWPYDIIDRITALLHGWLTGIDEEKLLPHECKLQSVAVSAGEKELFISFDQPFLSQEHALLTKWMVVESLLKTLRDNGITLPHIRFFVNYQVPFDYHLDFARPWPLDGLLTSQVTPNNYNSSSHPLTIILDPAGDARYSGRIIEDSYERGVTLFFTQELSKTLKKYLPQSSIIIARAPGEVVEPLRNVSLANQLNADFYCHINFYQEKAPAPHFLIAWVSTEGSDQWALPQKSSYLSLIPYHQAYKLQGNRSATIASILKTSLEKTNPAYVSTLAGIPLAPLMGSIVPSILLDIAIQHKEDVHKLVDPVAQAIVAAL